MEHFGRMARDATATDANGTDLNVVNLLASLATKLNAEGSALAYSTFLGGSDQDLGNGVAVDGSGNAWLNLDGTQVTDAGVKNLARAETGLKGLTTLNLISTQVTDAGVKELARAETGLKALSKRRFQPSSRLHPCENSARLKRRPLFRLKQSSNLRTGPRRLHQRPMARHEKVPAH